jgi:hypothetical protein
VNQALVVNLTRRNRSRMAVRREAMQRGKWTLRRGLGVLARGSRSWKEANTCCLRWAPPSRNLCLQFSQSAENCALPCPIRLPVLPLLVVHNGYNATPDAKNIETPCFSVLPKRFPAAALELCGLGDRHYPRHEVSYFMNNAGNMPPLTVLRQKGNVCYHMN